MRVNILPAHAHADLILRMCAQQLIHQQMLHEQAHKDATIAPILLLRRVQQIDKLQRPAKQLLELMTRQPRLHLIAGTQRVVMERHAVQNTDEQQRPMRPALGDVDGAAVVDGQEDVGRAGEVWQCGFEGERVLGFHQQEGHAGAQEDDARFGVLGEFFSFQVFFPEGDGVVG